MGRVIAYMLLCGYSPFGVGDNQEIIRNITRGNYRYQERYWHKISHEGEPPYSSARSNN